MEVPFDVFLDAVLLVRQRTQVLLVDFPVLRYNECGREADEATEAVGNVIIAHQDRVLHADFLDFRLDILVR